MNTGGDDARRAYPCALTDAMWQVVSAHLPVRDTTKGGRPLKHGHRLIIDTILYVLVSGCAWRLVPHDLAPWHAVYRWFRYWSALGVWDDIHDVLRDQVRQADGRDPAPTAAVLDSQSAKSACGGEQIGYDAGKRVRGRKRHLLVDTNGLLLVCMVHSASVQDRAGARLVLHSIDQQYPTIGLIWVDGGYANSVDASLIDWADHELGIKLEVVKRNDDIKGFQLLPRRWVVERTLCATRRSCAVRRWESKEV
ncbi:IS5 family transposase [Streptosporangium album]|uniref:IS5 family transposase n=1 Tax=Streptosporangium album TaxID=47479 RepID=UPI00160D51E9|nr:IS5 family transposase [Streptosporangium album]